METQTTSVVPGLPQTSLPHFDLTTVKARIQREHPHFSQIALEQMEADYREFLANCKANPGADIRPSPSMDIMWHTHILFTKNYFNHCRDFFGYYLHHRPDETNTGTCGEQCGPEIGYEIN